MHQQASQANHRVRITGKSMVPTLNVGDVVMYEKSPPKIGEVAVFMAGKGIIVHRIVACWQTRLGHHYIHRADASGRIGMVASHEILGVVRGLEPRPPRGIDAIGLWFLGRVALAYAEWQYLKRSRER